MSSRAAALFAPSRLEMSPQMRHDCAARTILAQVGDEGCAFRQRRPSQDSKTARYVNMADINRSLSTRRASAAAEESVVDLIELLFFAYRDFISDPDAILAKSDFGRAHHRVLHFVDRNPGLTVADLLDILKITKQSLARVLKELVEVRLHRAAHRTRGPPPAPALRDAGGPRAFRQPLGAAGSTHQGGARRPRPGSARHGHRLPLRHDRRAGARQGGAPRRRGDEAMSEPRTPDRHIPPTTPRIFSSSTTTCASARC